MTETNHKTLIIMRNAKSNGYKSALNDEGKEGLLKTANSLIANGIIPDIILCGEKKYSRETALRLRNIFNSRTMRNDITIEANDNLHSQTQSKSLSEIFAASPNTKGKKTVMFVTNGPNIDFLNAYEFGVENKLSASQAIKRDIEADTWGNISEKTLKGKTIKNSEVKFPTI